MRSGNEQENSDNGAHLTTKPHGPALLGKRTRPWVRPTRRQSKDNPATRFNNCMTPWRFKGAAVQAAFR